MVSLNGFIEVLKTYRHTLPKQTIQTLKGQAVAGDIVGATKGLATALNKKQDNKDRMTNAHRNTRYIAKTYDNLDYKTQLSIGLRK